jgi:adenylate cyclase, class 2
MHSTKEIEIKFRVRDPRALSRQLRRAGFRLVTPRTHEMNTLYDLPGNPLRKRGELLRLRLYGSNWVLTHKKKDKTGRHKSRIETETEVRDGRKMDAILRALGYTSVFRYEKFRAEWSGGKGHVVVDETPLGNFAEIEGPSRWIDQTARLLQVQPGDYITATYAELFFQWKRQARSSATEMTFAAIASRK